MEPLTWSAAGRLPSPGHPKSMADGRGAGAPGWARALHGPASGDPEATASPGRGASEMAPGALRAAGDALIGQRLTSDRELNVSLLIVRPWNHFPPTPRRAVGAAPLGERAASRAEGLEPLSVAARGRWSCCGWTARRCGRWRRRSRARSCTRCSPTRAWSCPALGAVVVLPLEPLCAGTVADAGAIPLIGGAGCRWRRSLTSWGESDPLRAVARRQRGSPSKRRHCACARSRARRRPARAPPAPRPRPARALHGEDSVGKRLGAIFAPEAPGAGGGGGCPGRPGCLADADSCAIGAIQVLCGAHAVGAACLESAAASAPETVGAIITALEVCVNGSNPVAAPEAGPTGAPRPAPRAPRPAP